MAEQSGASLITIHGRVRDAYYSGEPDYRAIEKAKSSVKIPVIANGGIFTEIDADKMIDKTGADGIMLARGGIADPFLICKLLGEVPKFTLKELMKEQLSIMATRYGEGRAYREFRKFVPYYFKGVPNSKDTRIKMQTADSIEELIRLIDLSF
jgi:tRNA-dihydrouridine synthase